MDDGLQGSPKDVVEDADDGERHRLIPHQPHLVLRDPGDEFPQHDQERVREEGDETEEQGEEDATHLQLHVLPASMVEGEPAGGKGDEVGEEEDVDGQARDQNQRSRREQREDGIPWFELP